MQVMHEAGLAHCDLKPGNVVLMPDGSTKLADFGAACAINSHTGRLATMHGNVMRDREIERLMKHHMNHIGRTTQDSLSAFGSAWGAAGCNQFSSQRSGLRDSRETQQECGSIDSGRGRIDSGLIDSGRIDENSNEHCIWTMPNVPIPDCPPPFDLQDPPTSQPATATVAATLTEESASLLMQPQQLEACKGSFDRIATFCQERNDFETRQTANRSELLRTFRSCPGSSTAILSESDTPEAKTQRRGVRWFSGSGGSEAGPKQLARSGTDAENHLLATQRSSLSMCSRIKAYSLRDVPMVCLLMCTCSMLKQQPVAKAFRRNCSSVAYTSCSEDSPSRYCCLLLKRLHDVIFHLLVFRECFLMFFRILPASGCFDFCRG